MSTPRNNPPTPNPPGNIEDQLALYFDNQATPQVVQAIQDWLEADPANAQTFAEYGYIERMIFCAQKKEDASAVFALLAEMEASAEADTVTLVGELPIDHAEESDSLSAHDLTAVGGYVLRRLFSNKTFMTAGIGALAAAILLIAVMLINPFAVETPAPLAMDPDTPVSIFSEPIVVAKLTATHDAQWAKDQRSVGENLHTGQRLALTEGFAEVTTQRGAVVILEAPCTVELLDSPNAVRLHQGKLVGICETETSKGFMVRTPQMGVIDLGTRFGVMANDQGTRVHVLEGEVEAIALAADFNVLPTKLTAGQTAAVQVGTDRIALSDKFPGRLIQDWRALTQAPELTGPISYEPSIPRDLRVGATESNDVRLFHEQSGILIRRSVGVNITTPGKYVGQDWLQTKALNQVTVDSYLVHFDNEDSVDELMRRIVTIRFDRPILGIVTTSDQLAATHDSLGVPGVMYGTQSKWLATEFHEARDGSGLDISNSRLNQDSPDTVTFSEDRRTVTLELSLREAIDQVRILVQSEQATVE